MPCPSKTTKTYNGSEVMGQDGIDVVEPRGHGNSPVMVIPARNDEY
jgi:hypothetical protein